MKEDIAQISTVKMPDICITPGYNIHRTCFELLLAEKCISVGST